MLEARKENKVYTINEQQKDRYLKDGFDIYKDGVIIEYTPLKKIKYSDHLLILNKAVADKENELLEQLELLKQNQSKPVDNVLELLKNYAETKSIDIGSSTSAKGILDKILETEKE